MHVSRALPVDMNSDQGTSRPFPASYAWANLSSLENLFPRSQEFLRARSKVPSSNVLTPCFVKRGLGTKFAAAAVDQ
jgi:hypothetical protein